MKTTFSSSSPRGAWRVLFKPVPVACLSFLIVLICASIFGPAWTGYAYDQMSSLQFAAPSWAHWCGTDLLGRDLFTRILHGGRISLTVGLIGTVVSLTVGVSYGMIAGYFGGKVDLVMMRFVDILYSLPRLVFVIVLITALDQFSRNVLGWLGLNDWVIHARMILLFIGLGIVEWLTMARIVRGQVLTLKEQQFVLAARTLGASTVRILFRHLLPNLIGIIIVYLTLTIPVVILEESFLSFLGLGIQAPQASWGSLISDGAGVLNPIHISWWLIACPGIIMGLTLLSLNLLGDHLRDFLDPRILKK